MKTILLCAAFLLIFATSAQGFVKRETNDPPALPSFSDIITEGERHLTEFTNSLKSLFTPETRDAELQKIGNNLSAQSEALSSKVSDLLKNINEAISSGQANEQLKQTADRLNDTLRNLIGKDNLENAERTGADLSEKVKSAVQAVVEESSKIAKNIETESAPLQEEIKTATKSAIKQAMDVADYIRQQLEESAAKVKTN